MLWDVVGRDVMGLEVMGGVCGEAGWIDVSGVVGMLMRGLFCGCWRILLCEGMKLGMYDCFGCYE
ncbi:hypothetical protein KMI_20g20010 [Encephalitozoon hellem]|nr:hypothetical protein KMI_20g20010 [Encephalitozoon hellem]